MSARTLRCLGSWLGSMALLHLAWEIAQVPLYTLYREASGGQIAFAVAHCTAGDVLIAAAAYGAAVLATRAADWPLGRPRPGTVVTIAAAVAYTAFSEWLNVYVRHAWAYSELMPQLLGIGISPLLQWVAVPLLALALTRKLQPASG